MSCFRECVSQKRIRFKEDGFNLDLSYITKQIIASGCPSFGFESIYRNPWRKMEKFLNYYHKGNYHIINLCCEPNREYDPALFDHNVTCFPHMDGHAPTMEEVIDCVQLVHRMILQGKVLLIHCKAGEGRTGTMINCILLYEAFCEQKEITAELKSSIFKYVFQKRGQKVKLPCQMRVIDNFYTLLRQCEESGTTTLCLDKEELVQFDLLEITADKPRDLDLYVTCSKNDVELYYKINSDHSFSICENIYKTQHGNNVSCGGQTRPRLPKGAGREDMILLQQKRKYTQTQLLIKECHFRRQKSVTVDKSIPLDGNVFIEAFCKKKLVGRAQFNMQFVNKDRLRLCTNDIDKNKVQLELLFSKAKETQKSGTVVDERREEPLLRRDEPI